MKRSCFVLLSIVVIFSTKAQQQNPPDILWKSLKSENFELIFPLEIESEAQRIANTLEWVYNYNTKSLNVKPKSVSTILYNRSNKSNAYAGIGPRRMGWYLTPPQSVTSVGNTEWIQGLAIHEYRHVVQYAKNRQHFTKFMTYFFGDIGQTMMRWSIPDWFFEGDAIVMETALAKGGRGMIPAFSMNIRAFSLENEKYTYDQAYLKSYKRYYPSHYHLGYPLTAFGRVKYGKDIWDKVLDRTNKRSWWPYAFGTSLKKYTGLSVKKFYAGAMSEYKTIWKKQDSLIQTSELEVVNKKKRRNFTNYFTPKYNSAGNIVCRKNSLDKISAFYEIKPDGAEKRLRNTDAGIFNLGNDILIWNRTIPNSRWGESSYSDIILYGLKSKLERRLSFKQQYLSPSLSFDGKQVAVVEHNLKQQTSLVILDANNGKVLKIFGKEIGQNDYFRTPVWSEDGQFIAFTQAKFKGTALSIINVETEEVRRILDYNWNNIGRPVFYKNYIIYNSDYSGIGNINAVDIETGQRYQVTSSKYGAYNAAISPDKSKMAYQEYTKDGFDIAEIYLNPSSWKKLEEVTQTDPGYYQTLVEQEGGQTINEANIPNKSYPVEDYKKMKDGIKIHSWGAFSSIPYIDVKFISNNYLNTLALTGGYLYNTNEKTNAGYLAFSYSKFFPVFSVVSTISEKKNTYPLTNDALSIRWNEFKLNAGVTIPLNLSRNVYNRSMSFGGGAEYYYIDDKPYRFIDETYSGNFTPLYLSFSFANYRNYALRDFAPKYGQFLDLDYKKIMPYDNDYEGYLFSARSSFYFPGILANNSLKLGASYEKQLSYDQNNSKRYYFSKKTSFARGYSSVVLDKFYKLSADYQLSLWSPDLSIGPLAYIKRIRLGGFYDYLKGGLAAQNLTYESIGGSVRFEFNVFRVRYPFEVGVQYAYRINDGDYEISFLLLGLPI